LFSEDKIIVNKEPFKKVPDRVLKLSEIKRVIWKYHEKKEISNNPLKGFTLECDTSLYYSGEPETLKQLKANISKVVFQYKV
jgi:hypothetical protein